MLTVSAMRVQTKMRKIRENSNNSLDVVTGKGFEDLIVQTLKCRKMHLSQPFFCKSLLRLLNFHLIVLNYSQIVL